MDRRYQTDKTYRWRFIKTRVALWLVSVGLFIAAWRHTTGTEDLTNVWTLGFALSCILGLAPEIHIQRTYRCPECGRRLGNPRIVQRPQDKKEYVYGCPTCGITWGTLTYVPTPDG